MRTPAEAAKLVCPIARTFGGEPDTLQHTCRGPACILWRWEALDAKDPRFMSAINREMACLAQDEATATGAKAKPAVRFHKQAVANVMKDPEAYGAPAKPEKGWCGLGHKPERPVDAEG